ncbi:glycosyltransferase [Parapedobacter sp.]
MLLVLANYPDEKARYEGMSQRVIAIDQLCATRERRYLTVSHRLYWKMETEQFADGGIQYRCNIFRHFSLIIRLIKQADTLYFHSVINVLPLLPFLSFIRREAHVVLDAHGVVPEELHYQGAARRGRLYGLAEQRIFRRVDTVVTVSDVMTAHFRRKYPEWESRAMRYPILPAHLQREPPMAGATPDNKVHVIYSGNLQSWQNVDLLISLIKENRSDRIKYTLLTGQPTDLKKRLLDLGVQLGSNIEVLTVSPHELRGYYQSAHYGFILRDDMLINRVACPTKMVEYLFYGITPIVKSSHIGDFEAMGYEYLRYQDFSANLLVRKSKKNRELMMRYVSDLRMVDFEQLIACER